MSHITEIRKRYNVWTADEGSQMTCALDGTFEPSVLGNDAKLLFSFEASTHEEAMSIYHLRVGYEPYKPFGESAKCPNDCGAYYYPDGSGECPFCGLIDEHIFKEYLIDVSEVKTTKEFWDKYVEVIASEGIRYFGKNLDALWDALAGGGPGFPDSDESVINIVNTQSLKIIDAGKLYNGLQKIAEDLDANENSVVKLNIE